jgi:hypothetical protein
MTGWFIALLTLAIIAGVPWLIVLGTRLGSLLAVAATAAGSLLLFVITLLITHLLGADIAVGIVADILAVGGSGIILLRRGWGTLHRPGRHAIALWLTPIAGVLGWTVPLGIAQIVPGASRVAWALNGDAINNINTARVILADHGLALSASENPEPLPAALLAAALAPGHGSIPATDLVVHEFSTFAIVWALLIAATCLTMGAVVGSAVSPRRPLLVAVASGAGSLLPLTWYAGGLPLQWSYLNANVAIPLLLASWLAFLAAKRTPLIAFSVLVALATLLLLTWTPLVLLPAGLGLVILARERARIRLLRGPSAVTFVAVLVPFILFLGINEVPALESQSGVLAIPGNDFPSTWGVVVGAALIAAATAFLPGRLRRDSLIRWGTVALIGAAAAASAALVLLANSQPDPWSAYYPKKLAWMLSVFLGAVALSSVVGLVCDRVPSLRASVVTVAITCSAVLTAAVVLPLGGWPETIVRIPAVRILSGSVWQTNNAAVSDVIRLTRPGHLGFLWKSGQPDEGFIDSRIILIEYGFRHPNQKMRAAAMAAYYSWRSTGAIDTSKIDSLCLFATRLPAGTTLITADPDLQSRLSASCPRSRLRVVIEPVGYPKPGRIGPYWPVDGIK